MLGPYTYLVFFTATVLLFSGTVLALDSALEARAKAKSSRSRTR